MPHSLSSSRKILLDAASLVDHLMLLFGVFVIAFFLRAARFKPNEPLALDPPRISINQVDVPEHPSVIIYFNQEGRVFAGKQEVSLKGLRSWVQAHSSELEVIWIKGDERTPFPVFESVLKAFTQNRIRHVILMGENQMRP